MPTRILDLSRPPDHDPLGNGRDSIEYMPDRVPRGYPRDVCRCSDCVQLFVQANNITADRYAVENYREHPSYVAHRWSSDASRYLGIPFPEGLRHRRPNSRWSRHEQEVPVPSFFDSVINRPLRYILKRSGRVWSAEVECNEVSVNEAARLLGVTEGRYSTRPDRAAIVVSPDGTVDAEIKISCMRDGSDTHADMAVATYQGLVRGGARAATNAGHHVHVDGTRLADLGTETTEQVMRAAWRTARVCSQALMPLAASGYSKHRHSHEHWMESNMLTSRQAIHGSRLWRAAQSRNDSNATIEYRLPNATLSPLRAQSFIAIPLGILDFAERATLDEDLKAAELLRQVDDRMSHANWFDEVTATSFLIDALRLSKDSKKCLAVAAYTSPSVSAKARALWEESTEGMPKLDSLVRKQEASTGRRVGATPRVRDEAGRFASAPVFAWPPQPRTQAEVEAAQEARRTATREQLFTFRAQTSTGNTISIGNIIDNAAAQRAVIWSDDPPESSENFDEDDYDGDED